MLSIELDVQLYSKAELDLDYDAESPMEGTVIDHHYDKWATVLVEIWNDILYIDGRNVVDTRLVDRWLDPQGYILAKYTGRRVPNARLLDFLLKHPEFIPKSWLRRPQIILFLGTIFRSLNRHERKFWIRGLSISSTKEVSGTHIDIHSPPDPLYRVALFKRIEHCKFE